MGREEGNKKSYIFTGLTESRFVSWLYFLSTDHIARNKNQSHRMVWFGRDL